DYDDLVIDITFIPFQSGESFVPSCSGCCETSIAGGVGYSAPQGQVAFPENNEISQWRWDILRETAQPFSEDGASVGSGIMQAVLEMGGLTKTVYYDTSEYDFSNAFSLGMTLDTSTLGSGRYEWTLSLTYDHGSDAAQVETQSGYSSIVDRSQSPYGYGVNLAGLSRLNLTDLNSETASGILWERSCGKQVWFASNGMTFMPEAGESANSTLMQNSDGTWLVRDQGETFLFSASGLLLTRTDDLTAETTVWTYNSDGTAASKTETGNRVTTYGYTNGRLASVTDLAGRVTQYEYDPLGRLIRLTEPDPDGDGELTGPETLYTYDGDSSRLASITDSSGKVTEYTWVQGILASRKTDGIVEYSQDPYALAAVADLSGSGFDAQHPAVLSAYTQSVGTHTDKNGSTTEYRYDSRGNVIWEKTASGKVTTRMFDTNGRKLKETVTVGGSGTTTRYEYDARGNLTKLIDHDGSAEQWTWDQTYDQMLSHTDQLGNRTLYTLDPMTGLTVQERLVVGAVDSSENGETDDIVTSYAYDSARRLASMTDALGVTTSYAYDTRGNLLRETIGESVTTYTYDSADRVASVTDPLGRTTQYSYDALDRLICTTYANGQTVTNRYDALGRLAETTDIHGAVTTYTYGTNGKIAEMESEGASISYTYDTLGRVLTETDSLNRVTSYTYDNGGKVTQITVSQGAGSAVISSTEYDSWGRIASETDAAGIQLAYTYDKLGRLTRIQRVNDSKFLETRTYDAAGNLRTVTDALGAVTSYAYDTAGNLTTVTAADGTKTTYTYDKLGRVLTQTDVLGGVTSYTYDVYGNLLTTTDALGRTTANGYDLAGQLLTTTDAEGNVTAYVYDTLGRTVSTTLRSADGLEFAASTTSYTYQTIDGKKYQTVTQTDALNNQTVSLYDLAGNLIRTTDAAGAQTVYTYDTEGQLLTVTDALNHVTSYTYDAFGSVSSITQADGSTYQYRSNAAGQLLSQTDPAGTVTVHTYDVTGQVSKTEVRDRNVPKALGHWLETAQTFDGIDDKVTIENTDQLNFSGEITLSAWVKIEETGGYRGILEHGYYGGREVFLRIASGKYQVGIYQSKTNSMAEAAVDPADIGTWVHLVGTYDGSSWNLYKNGELIASSPSTVGVLPVNCDWLIGGSQATNRCFKGEIRDAGIWNVAMTPDEVSTHYAQGFSQAVVNTATYDALGNVLTQTDAMGNTTSYTYDTMGRVLTVTDALNNVTSYTYDALGRLLTTTDARGTVTRNTYDAVGNLLQTKQYDSTELPPPVGKWLDIEQDFDGSSTINLGNPDSLNFSGEIAVSAWVKIDTTGGIKTILGHGPSGGKEVYLRLNGNSYQFGSWDSATNNHLVSAPIPAEDIGAWVHLVGTYDGVNWNLYRNGTLLASRADTVGCVPLTTNWYIGSSNGNARFFDGEIRDLTIWNTSLTASQAAAVYAETAPSADYPTVVTSYTYDALNRL
ncbi:MAG: hypothetical protein IJB20_03865, partial [Clostridia bacterium]|nr:hypothetical protein [Clostridia bacterium]